MDMLKHGPGEMHGGRPGLRQCRFGRGAVARREIGVKIVGISDHDGRRFTIRKGIDVAAAEQHVAKKGNLRAFPKANRVDPNELLTLPCDMLVPCRGRARDHGKQRRQDPSAAFWPKARTARPRPRPICILNERWDEVFVIPDILCNAGGVIVSYFEWVQGLQSLFWTETEVTDKLFRILEHSFAQVIKRAKKRQGLAPHRGDGDRRRTGDESETHARIVPLSPG